MRRSGAVDSDLPSLKQDTGQIDTISVIDISIIFGHFAFLNRIHEPHGLQTRDT